MNSWIAEIRLSNQLIANGKIEEPSEVVRWMGMLQAQDYLGALWAIGLRVRDAREGEVERAIAERSLVRTWPARGTLHFVAGADVRWMLELLTPRNIARSAGRYRQLELDEKTFKQSGEILQKALQGRKQLTRGVLYQLFEAAQIATGGQRGIHILGRLAQEGLICLGTREGKQHTFTLLEEWAPEAKTMEREQALAELTRRYFTSHGPATVQDFVWWSGLTTTDAKAGLELAKEDLEGEAIDGKTYWFSGEVSAGGSAISKAYLLPAFDEYLVGYRERSDVLDPKYLKQTNAGGGMLSPVIVINGQVAGTWKRELKKGSVRIKPKWFTEANELQEQALAEAATQYGEFLGMEAMVVQESRGR